MIYNLDLYSTPVNYSYHKYYLFPSICGGLISLIIYLLLIAYFVYLLYDMTERENPYVYITKYYNDIPPSLNIFYNKSDFDEGFKAKEIDDEKKEAYWFFKIEIAKGDEKINIENNDININIYQKSTDSSKEKKLTHKFINDYYYISDDSFVLEGLYGFNNFSWLEIDFQKKETNKPSDEFINSLKINFYYENHIINLTNFHKDITPNTEDEVYWELLPNHTKISELKLSLDTIGTIDTYLPTYLNNYKKKYTIFAKEWDDQLKYIENNTLLKIRIFLDRHSLKTERKFDDVFSIFALIGGLIGLIIPLGTILVFCIRDFRMTENMMNDSYYIIDPAEITEIPTFDVFLKNHFNKLLKISKNPKKHKRNKINQNLIKNEIEKDLMDNEGITKNSFNPLEKFFTLKRLENLFGKSRDQLLVKADDNNLKNNERIEYNIDYTNINQKQYVIYKLIYDCAKYKSQPDFKFSLFELICFYCFNSCKKKKRKIIEDIDLNDKEIRSSKNQIHVKNFDLKTLKEEDVTIKKSDLKSCVYKSALKKLGLDFDLINILKTEEGFENFEKMIFEKYERVIFNLESKPIIKLSDIEKKENGENEEEEDDIDDKEKKELKELFILNNVLNDMMNDKNELKKYQIRLLHSIGRSYKDIQLFQSVKNGKDITKEIEDLRKNKDKDKTNNSNITTIRGTESVLLSSLNNSEYDKTKKENDINNEEISTKRKGSGILNEEYTTNY
jgi:hypothetical protein